MNSKVTREIKLSEKLVQLVTTLQNELKSLQEQFKTKSEQLGTTLSGVCLQEGVDILTEGLELSADCTTVFVTAPNLEEPKVELPKKKK